MAEAHQIVSYEGTYVVEHDDEGLNINIQTYELWPDGTFTWTVIELEKDHDDSSTQTGYWTTNIQEADLVLIFENKQIPKEEYVWIGNRLYDTDVEDRYLRKRE